MKYKSLMNVNTGIILGVLLGILSGHFDISFINQIANITSQIFINLLKLVSTPIIFLSIISTISGMDSAEDFKFLGKKIIKYTFFTTYIASFIAFVLFLILDPANTATAVSEGEKVIDFEKGYIGYLIQAIPSNIIQPFSEHHVIGVLFLAILFSVAVLALPEGQRKPLHTLFSSLNALVMKIASWIVKLIPLAIWSFITLLMKDMQTMVHIKQIVFYLLCVVGANLIQGFVILPLIIKSRGISPVKLAYGMLPALSLAFFSKSSSATLPMTMRCAEERVGMPKRLSNLAFPLCTAINMNGCAAFIFITVLFVSMSQGVHYSVIEMFMWTFIATIAAVGNAGVPMGCYFLSSAFLVAMNVPLNILAIILPFYTIIDMLETMINVWSDSCVVAMVDKELTAQEAVSPISAENAIE
jgi:Na+/H+-dicarboxylate symporter